MQEQRRFFEAAVQEAVLCAPTLLFLERVDHLTPVSQVCVLINLSQETCRLVRSSST